MWSLVSGWELGFLGKGIVTWSNLGHLVQIHNGDTAHLFSNLNAMVKAVHFKRCQHEIPMRLFQRLCYVLSHGSKRWCQPLTAANIFCWKVFQKQLQTCSAQLSSLRQQSQHIHIQNAVKLNSRTNIPNLKHWRQEVFRVQIISKQCRISESPGDVECLLSTSQSIRRNRLNLTDCSEKRPNYALFTNLCHHLLDILEFSLK